MINLLPTAYAESIRFGRQNTKLRAWLIGAVVAIAGLIVIIAGGWVYINQQAKALQNNINTTNQQLQAQDLSKVQADAKTISSDVQVINRVLSSEVDFAKLIQAIGNDMPPGAILTSLSLSNKVSGGLDLSAGIVNSDTAAQVAVNLSQASNQLFAKVDIVNINCPATPPPGPYHCNATFRALFSTTAQSKYLSVPKEGQQ